MATKTVSLDLCDICHANRKEAEATDEITFRGKKHLLCKPHGDKMADELEKICTLPKSAYEAA
ncbi:hypothetical protein C9F11_10240 [Streptomyces sp. YIM 121038]|uniref:hypothetical protein n=1 Tax=Streptomyces sp. YIM 121038 TaxID=2136401 RepID=UPI001110B632|nr:hypothetical protein [Streptomyces sp. YIM 121038]QCX75728.1 hypothetical protein C9F11_10240 [Streptomyces sp. YIM 121038]